MASYNIYQNGVKIGDSKNTEFTMDKLEVGTVYEVRITAVDNAGNESIPAPFKFTFTEPEKENFTLKAAANAEEMGIVSVEPQQDSYEAGTEVTVKAEAKERIPLCKLDKDRNRGRSQHRSSIQVCNHRKYRSDCKLCERRSARRNLPCNDQSQ